MSRRAFGANNSDARWGDWQQAMRADPIAPSGYARSSQGEDFSEMLVLYSTVKGTPEEAQMRRLFPNRFAILDRMMAPGGS